MSHTVDPPIAVQAFFQTWWSQQDSDTKATVKRLVAGGQLDFVNGGWCMCVQASVAVCVRACGCAFTRGLCASACVSATVRDIRGIFASVRACVYLGVPLHTRLGVMHVSPVCLTASCRKMLLVVQARRSDDALHGHDRPNDAGPHVPDAGVWCGAAHRMANRPLRTLRHQCRAGTGTPPIFLNPVDS